MTKRKKNFINNKDFYEAIVDYKSKIQEYEDGKRNSRPIPSDYIGKCFLEIATNLSRKGNFNGYTFKDEMVGDAIINCASVMDNFNPEKYNNPFAYFTQICWYAFIRRIEYEKKQSYIKHSMHVKQSILSDIPMEIDDKSFADLVEKFEKKKK